jgi:predicted DNA-binding transcriptional regulator AlpA
MTDDLAAAILEELRAIRQAVEVNQHDGLLTAAEVAQRFGIGREWIYQNADRLGAIRLPSPTGQKPRLRFDPETVRAAITDPEPTPPSTQPKVDLLPIGGRK